jgi:hypothetical protein
MGWFFLLKLKNLSLCHHDYPVSGISFPSKEIALDLYKTGQNIIYFDNLRKRIETSLF